MAGPKKKTPVAAAAKKPPLDPNKKPDHRKILAFVAACDDAGKLGLLVRNARAQGVAEVADAAFRKLVALVPAERPGTVEHDFWQTVHAFEFSLSEERGKTTRLSRTRQKVAKVGVVQTLRDWATGTQETAGFKMLLERGMPEFTGEAITLRHPEHFEPATLDAARQRLTVAGVDLNMLA